ncbi:MAG TPA: site-2 protease family protein [Candidatus Aminicenantes bacterium]|nr:site-2 protease family protein [Candidatus Aminicenantes bacterium]
MTRRGKVLRLFLFVLTFLSTLLVGLEYAVSYYHLPLETGSLWRRVAADPILLSHGLWYAVPVMAILLAHELGHYRACRRHGIGASWPLFIPAPTLLGTLGAFIRIHAPFPSKRALFDVGVAGPLAGFLLTLPVLAIGICLSCVEPVLEGGDGGLALGEPLGFMLLAHVILGKAAAGTVLVHPTAFAGWVGLLATAFNLFPIGQLDGGHLAYAVFGRRIALVLSVGAVLGLVALGIFVWPGWLVWALLMTLVGLRHPWVHASERLERRRLLLAAAALLAFVLSFAPLPMRIDSF